MIRMLLCLLLTMTFANNAAAQWPDGTLVFSNLRTPFGRWLNRVGPMEYSHVGIVIDNKVVEAALPRVQKVPVRTAERTHGTYEYWVPTQPYSVHEVAGMRSHSQLQIGRPYGVARWLWPGTQINRHKIYCSELVRDVLNASGRWSLHSQSGYDPGKLWHAVRSQYSHRTTVNR